MAHAFVAFLILHQVIGVIALEAFRDVISIRIRAFHAVGGAGETPHPIKSPVVSVHALVTLQTWVVTLVAIGYSIISGAPGYGAGIRSDRRAHFILRVDWWV